MSESNQKLLKGILIALLEGKSREEKSKILKDAGFNKMEICDLIGISKEAEQKRKQRAKKKK